MTDEEKVYSNDYADIVALAGDISEDIYKAENVLVHNIGTRYSIVYVPRETLARFGISERSYEPFVMGLCQSYLSDSGISQVLDQSTLNVDGSGVLIGIADTGINFDDEDFIYENGETKIAAYWDQSDPNGEPPLGQMYGTEYSREAINEALQNGTVLSAADRSGHGTRLARIALSASPQSELLVVKLKQAKPHLMEENFFADTDAFASSDLMTALDYLIGKSEELERPISVIIGLGTSQGAHNGLSLLEQYINELSLRTGVCICVAAGNEGLSLHHYYSNTADRERTAELNVENSRGFTMWFWNDFICRASIGVTSPLGEVVQPLQPVNLSNSSFSLPLGGGGVDIQYRLPIDEKQLTIVTLKNPVSGIWRINIRFSRTGICGIDAWLPMNQFLNGRVTFASPSTATTMTVPATAPLIITMGGYNTATGGIYENTGRGPNSRGVIKPDITAPAVDILGASGTSNAAAITAGAAALLLQWGIVLGNNSGIRTEVIKTYLIAGAEQPVPNLETGQEGFPNNLWGYGKINLYNTFRQIF